MTMLNVQLPDDVKRLAEARAAEAGCADVAEYVARLIQAEATGAPEGMWIDCDEGLEELVRNRLAGPWVEMDEQDLAQMREELEARLDARDEGRQP